MIVFLIYIYIHKKRIEKESIRKTEHQRSTVLISDETSELPRAFLNSSLVILTHGWIALPHSNVSKCSIRTIPNFKSIQQ